MLYIEVVGVVLFGIAGICSLFGRFRPAAVSDTADASAAQLSPACLEPELRRLAAAVEMADQLERELTPVFPDPESDGRVLPVDSDQRVRA